MLSKRRTESHDRISEPTRNRVLLKAGGVLAFIAGAYDLWYGFVMSFLVPGAPGEAYFQKDQ